MENIAKIARELKIDSKQVEATIDLLEADNTIPFIARYRKEITGSLDEEQIRDIADLLEKLRALDERRDTVIKTIADQGQLTEELKANILAAETRVQLEDIYQPYKPKRKTRASVARENGLQPLADLILDQALVNQTLAELGLPYLSEAVPDPNVAWSGARDIVAEIISDNTISPTSRIEIILGAEPTIAITKKHN